MIPERLEDTLDMLQDCIDAELIMFDQITSYNEMHGTFYDEETILNEYRQKHGINSFTEEQYSSINDPVYLGIEENSLETRSIIKHN